MPVSAAAQSTTTGAVRGTIVGPTAAPIPRALVTLTPLGAGAAREATTDNAGVFSLTQVTPGSYEVRVEAVGFRPVVARTLTVGSGERRTVDLTLGAATPPVISVDTLSLAGSSSTRFRAGGLTFGSAEIDDLPSRYGDLASVVSLSPAFDDALGAQGLPGGMTRVVADGVPFYRAPHPTALSEQLPDGLFPRAAISGVTAFHNAPDIEWSGAAGGYVAISTRSSTDDLGLEADAAYSGDPLWSSSELDFEAPPLTSWQGGVRGTVAFEPGVSQLVLSGEALNQQTPLTPRISETVAGGLGGLDPDLLASLGAPSVETFTRYSGMARFDAQQAGSNRIFFRGAGSYSKRAFDGPGPISLSGLAAPTEETVEFSTAAAFVSEYSRSLTFELRGGVSGSYREFGPDVEDLPSAMLVGDYVSLGNALSSMGESSRTDLVLIPSGIYEARSGTLRFGIAMRASKHAMEHSSNSDGAFFFSDPAAVLAGSGYGVQTSSPAVSFGTREIGLFAQYDATPATGVSLSLGGRYDYEAFSVGELGANADWATASGLANEDVLDHHNQFGARGSISWDPGGSAGSLIFLTASLSEGDLDTRALYQLFSQDVSATDRRFAGSGLDWPDDEVTGTPLPTLSLFGPDMRAPRSGNVSLGITQPVVSGLSIVLRGSLRRTDFLIRRRNLNLPVAPMAVDAYGRDVFGTLEQDGSLVTTTTGDERRFPDFGPIWALDPDGWSKYRGFTVGLEHSGQAVELYGSYTFSETLDNWIGARSGFVEATLSPGLPTPATEDDWSEGTSDFDVPHRVAAGMTMHLSRATVSGTYHYSTGVPFTPRYRAGVDANGDGSVFNDIAFVPGDTQLQAILDAWPCLEEQASSFAVRNSCRAPARHSVDARLSVVLGNLMGRTASLVIDAFDLIENGGGVVDDALLLVDPDGSIDTAADGTITVPVSLNPDFGEVVYPASRGRMIRIGVKVGG